MSTARSIDRNLVSFTVHVALLLVLSFFVMLFCDMKRSASSAQLPELQGHHPRMYPYYPHWPRLCTGWLAVVIGSLARAISSAGNLSCPHWCLHCPVREAYIETRRNTMQLAKLALKHNR